MKHKHYDMICAKAGNMDLVVFVKCGKFDKWKVTETPFCFPLSEFEDVYYFICLPQHKDACLHWLNGGDIQNNITKHKRSDSWVDFMPFNFPLCERWSQDCNFMRESSSFRIKPRKEKRWIGIDKAGCCTNAYETRDDVIGYLGIDYKDDGWQLIEIEVEV